MYEKPLNGASLCIYLKRKPNKLGDDLTDFEAPRYFLGKLESKTKSFTGIGGLYMANTQTYFRTNNLSLTSDEMKKDDVIAQVRSKNDLSLKKLRLWRVSTAECLVGELTLRYGNEDEDERHAPKRITVQ
jgi:hypothetical protein